MIDHSQFSILFLSLSSSILHYNQRQPHWMELFSVSKRSSEYLSHYRLHHLHHSIRLFVQLYFFQSLSTCDNSRSNIVDQPQWYFQQEFSVAHFAHCCLFEEMWRTFLDFITETEGTDQMKTSFWSRQTLCTCAGFSVIDSFTRSTITEINVNGTESIR